MCAFKKLPSTIRKHPPKAKYHKDPSVFVCAFSKRTGRTPREYIYEKLSGGSEVYAVRYLFNIEAAYISRENNCKFFDFDYFYSANKETTVATQNKPTAQSGRPQQAGKPWSAEAEKELCKMYDDGATAQVLCNYFQRTRASIAARLVRLGKISVRSELK